jgi:hypothetical protein
MGNTANTIPDEVIYALAKPLGRIVGEFMARPGQWEKYREWYEAQMKAGNPLGLTPENFDETDRAPPGG